MERRHDWIVAVLLFHLFKKRIYEDQWNGFSQVGRPSCYPFIRHPSISVEVQSTEQNAKY